MVKGRDIMKVGEKKTATVLNAKALLSNPNTTVYTSNLFTSRNVKILSIVYFTKIL
jgi:hypothetical protein